MIRFSAAVAAIFCFVEPGFVVADVSVPGKIDYNRDIRPILSENCFKCHGFDEKAREADRRLDTREGAIADSEGVRAIVPGKLDESELHLRIRSHDRDEMMPPPKSGKKLTDAQRDLLDRWILEGAAYAKHWAFEPPRTVAPPAVSDAAWPKNFIDGYVLARLDREGLKPAPEADRETLIRRLSLDLIGLPPTIEETDAFLNDTSENAYEKVVDRLLNSPHYGERWARKWLDLARYADTNGYEKDRPRSIWPWRDWVINAMNSDMPFDQFTIEQLAGDLLPNATQTQRVATGFHRNTMLNEEGGIDPLEFRFHAMTDRVATTGTTWLGLTVGCAQCHTHKYDPIPHREYYQFMAFFNNADERDLDLSSADLEKRRREQTEKITQRIAQLPEQWPIDAFTWVTPRPASVATESGQTPQILDDGSALFSGKSPPTDTYTFIIDGKPGQSISALRLEALTDPSLPSKGPGRVAHGNFVLSEISIAVAPQDAPAQSRPVKIARAEADAAQNSFPVTHAIDDNRATGWAVQLEGADWHVTRTAIFHFTEPVAIPAGARFTTRLAQVYGGDHTIGRPRLSLGSVLENGGSVADRRRAAVDAAFAKWLAHERAANVAWTRLRPVELKSNLPYLTVENDLSVFASGDFTKSDWYELRFEPLPKNVTAFRLEALPDDRLPKHGPGMTYYEGPKGDFFLGEFQLLVDGKPVRFRRATESYAKNAMGANAATAALAIDGDPQTGWSTSGREGEPHEAVFELETPLNSTGPVQVKMMFGRHYACSLGRFRISTTTDPRQPQARAIPDDIAQILALPADQLSDAQRTRLREQFFLAAPELAGARAEIDKLRKSIPAPATTLVFQERPPDHPRPTFVHKRGEYLQPAERVGADVFECLPPLPPSAPHDRLTFARWLVSRENPLTARVTVNRLWAAMFGQGIVKTVEDFGVQGELPSHPQLLDALAVRFMDDGWSRKKILRLIATSAAYRQSSRCSPELHARDPENRLLARGPRSRLEAEQIRDATLFAASLLNTKIGGPSVFPPQVEGVSEVAYGSPKWDPSPGPDRFRRGLYTFAKRTAPFAMATTFDAPSGEACLARRDRSNTPLQALTLLNDVVFVEAARALGKMLAEDPAPVSERVTNLYRRCLTRFPSSEEREMVEHFLEAQRTRLKTGELNPLKLGGDGAGNAVERAAWTAVARAVLNLDETITKS